MKWIQLKLEDSVSETETEKLLIHYFEYLYSQYGKPMGLTLYRKKLNESESVFYLSVPPMLELDFDDLFDYFTAVEIKNPEGIKLEYIAGYKSENSVSL